ncbi:MAG TPA: TIGR00296 family protein, partial [Nitrososphaera sp.]|nr:TIGR00296 family protein [Nitrososphaera sp.]
MLHEDVEFFSPYWLDRPGLISVIEGAELVRLARTAVEKFLYESVIIKPGREVLDKAGVFVTLNYITRSGMEHLRGCIGFPLPEKTLYQGVIEAAISAATEDPRFPPLDSEDLNNIIFEVSVLTPPQQIRVNNIADY